MTRRLLVITVRDWLGILALTEGDRDATAEIQVECKTDLNCSHAESAGPYSALNPAWQA